MSQRIDALTDLLKPNPFISSPGDLLAHNLAAQIALVPQFKKLFGDFIDGYMRMDYGIRNLPALRIYQEESYTMEADNWFIVGQLECDIILPPNLRRELLHTVSDIVSGALVQQFRRTSFFQTLQGLVPGLNWLGQSITVSKNRAFQMGEEEMVPLVVMSVNFRVDLREWDLYLEANDRTVNDPFERTLATLVTIASTIAAQNADGTTDEGASIEAIVEVDPEDSEYLLTEDGLIIETEDGQGLIL